MNLEPKAVRSRVGLPVFEATTKKPEPAPNGYYDVPFLKQPTWDWRIAAYFFLESVSAGSFLMASISDVTAPGRHPNIRRAGYYLALGAFLPCPPLLISDLGRPERFHHMLRILKPTSPMSHGSWSLVAYSAPMGVLATEQLLRELHGLPEIARTVARLVPTRVLGSAGIPCALMLATYPGVLLSTTSNPLWSRTHLLGALFAASAVHAGASSVALALRDAHTDERARIERIEKIAAVAEGLALAAVLAATGAQAKPLLRGRYSRLFLFGAVGAGIALPFLLKILAPKSGRIGRIARIASSALSLAGSLALKLAFTYAGRDAAHDARASHRAAAKHD